ncbi:RNase3 domain protein [Cordyceps militaris CM01]|uniref:RNase3 domain protein n=1 Tax=Cordyceps militaris (strain CM01) TaxID=983644 RepID=G3J4L1_CORMM|nr:RNase3 domain protein [Cordyceps militaris CM01]EGX95881.1 RNase3 domain protein [Cordyceps militaris CM01]
MVTFALPSDGDSVASTNGTPRARPPLPFARRSYGASPFTKASAKHLGTPQSAPSRRFFSSRGDTPAGALSKSNISTARNIFQASAHTQSPPSGPFSPNLPQSTMKKVFAPGATPEPSRVYRESTASAAPRGMAAKSSDKDLFPMRISSPPRELTGEALARKVPKEWNSKGSIYADQFLAHLCPHHLDEEQRRQFFCILDLRRLKYAANEIFARKDWKLNVINFAKEFEKSRSIILLRYGLYEFQNVKPTKEVLKRWRREHGLPEPEEEEAEAVEATPSKTVPSKKRKADDDLTKDTVSSDANSFGKRQTTDKVGQDAPAPIATPQPTGKNKRKASVGEEDQPLKRSTPSATKTLFEKIANKTTEVSTPRPSPFAPKPAAGGLARSVFTNIKASAGQVPSGSAPTGASNIFGYLSDASSAKNSGVDADSESDSETDQDASPAAQPAEEQSAEASAVEVEEVAASTVADDSTRESTPGRSLFDRLTKGTDGEPVRAAEPSQSPAETTVPAETIAPVDKTWNPSTTPLKFAPSASQANPFGSSQPSDASALFGAKPSGPAGSNPFGAPKAVESIEKSAGLASSASNIFAPKSTAPSNLFGTKPATTDKPATPAADSSKDGGESDKENDSQPAKKPAFDFKPSSATSASGLFGAKLAASTADTAAEPAKPASNLFGAAAAKPAASGLLGTVDKAKESTPVMQSSTLFGAKPSDPAKASSTEASAPITTGAPVFGAQTTPAATSFFGGASATPSKPLFGATAPKTDAPATAAPAATPMFSFGSNSTVSTQPAAGKPLFAPKSPEATKTNSGTIFGSPMKQDEQSPAKKVFGGGTSSAPGSFTFATATPSVNLFGGAVGGNTATNGNTSVSFGAPSTGNGSSSFGFNFSSGGTGSTDASSTNTSFANPFGGNSGSNSQSINPPSSSMFNFGAASATPASGSATFQFGAAGGASAPIGGGTTLGGSNPASGNSTPLFGGASAGSASGFSFTAAQPQSGNMFQAAPSFGASLQPPSGGSSITGTNSPLNLAGGSSLATTPAVGTPEPSGQAEAIKNGDDEEGEKHEQINLTDGAESDEEAVHEVRAKVLEFVPDEQTDGEDKPKPKSPWTTKGVGLLRVLKHKETNAVRLLLRAEPRGNVAINRVLLPNATYKADGKYVRITTSNEAGDGLQTWMLQVKSKDVAQVLAEAFEEQKVHNKQVE